MLLIVNEVIHGEKTANVNHRVAKADTRYNYISTVKPQGVMSSVTSLSDVFHFILGLAKAEWCSSKS